MSKKLLAKFYADVDPSKIQYISEFFRMYPDALTLYDKLAAKYPGKPVPRPSKAAQGDLFKVLELGSRVVSSAQVRAAFRRLSVEFHPDKHTMGNPEWAGAQFAAVASAYEVLSDAARRGRWEQEHPDENAPIKDDGTPMMHTVLDQATHDRLIAGEPDAKWLLMFTMSQCSFCDELQAVWDEVGAKVQFDGVKLGVVDCDRDPRLCDLYNVQTVPAVHLVLAREGHTEAFRGRLESPMRDVAVPQIVPFVQRAVRLQSDIESLGGVAEFNATVLGSEDFWVVYFGQAPGKDAESSAQQQCPLCSGAYSLLRHLSASMRAVGRVGKVDCGEAFHLCAFALSKGNPEGWTMSSGDLPRFMIYRSAPKAELEAEGLSSAHVIKGFGESLLPRNFVSENEVYGAVTVMEKSVRLANAHLVAEGGLRPFQDEEDRKFGDKQEAEHKEPEAPEVPQEPPQPPPMMYQDDGGMDAPMMIGN